MERFARLYRRLDATTRTSEKVAALEEYFRDAPPNDAVWTLFFLTGRRIKRAITSAELRAFAVETTGVPGWLLDESFDAVGDLSETIALLLPEPAKSLPMPLHEVVEDVIVPMRRMDLAARRAAIMSVWNALPGEQRFLFHKLISGSFRVGVSRTLAVRALANVAGVEQAEMDHRVMGDWEPTPESFARIMSGVPGEGNLVRPYPFYLASQLEGPVEALSPREHWQAEWKWDGIRAQIVRRAGRVLVWSRGEELVTDRFPEVARAAEAIPDGTVLDGEILAWEPGDSRPLPFSALQTRIGRTGRVAQGEWLFADTPVVFLCYDLLELDGNDVRAWPLSQRRAQLEQLLRESAVDARTIRLSPVVDAPAWEALAELRQGSREGRVEGLMLKRLDSPYGVGRTRGDWWKWKIDPYAVDAVLIAAQPGHGKRASLFTDYTFGVWTGPERGEGELVPMAKAYSGLTDAEIKLVDAFVRKNTVSKHGPVRVVTPELVFEIAFEAIQASVRHRSGIALRFPRMARWRQDKKPAEADTLGFLQALLREREAR